MSGMKRLDGGMKRSEAGIKRLSPKLMKARKPLQEPDIDDPMEGQEYDEEQPAEHAKAAMSAALKGLAQRRADEAASMALTTDGAFYFVAIFDSRDQKMAFLKGVGITDGDIYVDGRVLADRMEVEIPEVKTKMPGLFRVDKKYAEMAMKPPAKGGGRKK